MLLVYDQSVELFSITAMTVAALVAIGAVIAALIVLFRKFRAKFVPVVGGAAVYLTFTYMLFIIIQAALISMPGVGDMMRSSVIGAIAEHAVVVAVLSFVGRYIGSQVLFNEKQNGQFNGVQNALLFGVGFSVIATVYISFNYLTYITMAQTINSTGIDEIMATVTDDDGTLLNMMLNLCDTEWYFFLLGGFERVLALIFDMGISVVLYAVIAKNMKKIWIYAALAFQVVFSVPQVIIESGYNCNMYLAFVFQIVITAAFVFILFKFVKPYVIDDVEKVTKRIEKKSFPKFNNSLKNQ